MIKIKSSLLATYHEFMSQLLKKVVGKNGEIELYKDKVIIDRKRSSDYFFKGLRGKTSLVIDQIASVRFKKAGFLTNGYIRVDIKGGLLQAIRDENTIIFNRAQNQDFKEIKNMIEERM